MTFKYSFGDYLHGKDGADDVTGIVRGIELITNDDVLYKIKTSWFAESSITNPADFIVPCEVINDLVLELKKARAFYHGAGNYKNEDKITYLLNTIKYIGDNS